MEHETNLTKVKDLLCNSYFPEIDQDANCGSEEDKTAESEGDVTDELSQDLPENFGK